MRQYIPKIKEYDIVAPPCDNCNATQYKECADIPLSCEAWRIYEQKGIVLTGKIGRLFENYEIERQDA